MPSAKEFLAEPQKSAREFLGAPEFYEGGQFNGEHYDQLFSSGGPSAFLEAFGQGFRQAWGTEPLGIDRVIDPKAHPPEVMAGKTYADEIRELSTIPTLKLFNESVLRPLAAIGDASMRVLYGTARGLAATADVPPGYTLGNVLAGVAAPIGAGLSTLLEAGEIPGVAALPGHIAQLEAYRDVTRGDRARENTPEPYGPPAPRREVILPERPEGPPIEFSIDPDIHAKARAQAPETFDLLDRFREQRDVISQQIEQLGGPFVEIGPEGEAVPLSTRLAEVAERIARDDVAPEAVHLDRSLREQLAEIDKQIFDLVPEVREAYRQAEPPIEVRTEPVAVAEEPTPTREVETLTQRRPSIQQDVARQMVDAGRPIEEAQAAGRLWQAYYESRANRFEGRLGTARDLYELEAPDIKAGDLKAAGAFRRFENTVLLNERANASTIIHESGHVFLEDLLKDAARDQATEEIKNDLNVVKAWLQIEGDRPTQKQHEQFARGFEHYLMEGIAPSPRLAQVFAKFRDWMVRLYKAVGGLRNDRPLTDPVRQFFDRLLASQRDDVVIAPERPIGENFADLHERDLANTPPEDHLAKAEQIRAERDIAASLDGRLREELRVEREYARSDEAGTGTEGTPVAAGGAAGPEPTAGREGGAEEPPTQRISGTKVEEPSNPERIGGREFVDEQGNYRTEGITTPEDVPAAIEQGAAEFPELVSRPITPGDYLDLSDGLGMIPEKLDIENLRERLNPATVRSSIKLLRQLEHDIRAEAKNVSATSDLTEFARLLAKRDMVESYILGAREAWGQAGLELQKLYRASEGGDLTRFLKETTGRSYGTLLQMARSIEDMTDQGQINKFARDTKGRLWAPIIAYRNNAILSGVYTHTVYAIGNFLRALSDPLVSELSYVAQRGAEALGKEIPEGERIYAREATASLLSMGRGMREGWKAAVPAFYSGFQRKLPGSRGYATPFAQMSPVDVLTMPPHFGIPVRTIAGIHSFGETMRYEQAKARLATRQALSEGLTGDDLSARIQTLRADPPPEMIEAAFQRNGQVMWDVPKEVKEWADIAARSTQVANREMYINPPDYNSRQAQFVRWVHSHPLGELMFPFLSIHMQILKEDYGVHLPTGMLFKDIRENLMGAKGAAAQSEAIGRQLFGMSIFATFAGLAYEGLAQGGGPVNKAENDAWRLIHLPYSIEIGGLKIPMKGLPVIGDIGMMAADLVGAIRHMDGQTYAEIATEYFRAFAHPALDEGILRDTEELTNAINEPGRYGARYLLNFATSFVPFSSFSRQFNNFWYGNQKDIHGVSWKSVTDSVRATIPFANYGVQNSIDVFGRPIPARDSIVHGLTGAFSGYVDEWHQDPAAQFLDKHQLGIARPLRKIDGVDLTPEQYERYSMVRGDLIHKQIMRALPVLEKAPSRGMMMLEISKMEKHATKAAEAAVVMQYRGTPDDIIPQAIQKKRELLKGP